MVVPDLILSRQMEILVFVDRDAPLVWGHVPVYMFGLWAIPVNLAVWLGMTLEELEGPIAHIPRRPLPCLLDPVQSLQQHCVRQAQPFFRPFFPLVQSGFGGGLVLIFALYGC